MPRFIYTIALGLFGLFLLGNFKCIKECEYPFLLRDWQSVLLNNSGSEPLVSDSPIPRLAFGLRLSTQMSNDGQDTLRLSDTEECYLAALHPLRKIQLFAEEGFDSIATGEDISPRFRIRYSAYSTLDYLSLDNNYNYFNYPPYAENGAFDIDLLMVEPPSLPGTYHFSVKIQFDSLNMPLNRDTFIILPTVQLQ